MKLYGRLNMLRETLVALASDAQGQLDYLKGMEVQVLVDELALDYDGIAASAPDMLDNGEIDAEQFECIRSLDEMLARMSGPLNAHLWTEDALFSSSEWDQIRHAARACLSLFSDKRP